MTATNAELADQAAPLDALLIDAALGPVRRFTPDLSTARWATSLARRPLTCARRVRDLASEAVGAAIGTSTLAPDKRDRRFTDPAWSENPAAAPDRAGLPGRWSDGRPARRRRRARLARRATRALPGREPDRGDVARATSRCSTPPPPRWRSTPPGPAWLRGGAQLVKDLASAPRIPEMVDKSGFEVGGNIAATPGAVVLRTEVFELIQYAPQTEEVYEVPLLIVPPTINKFYAIDLAPERQPGRVPRPPGPADVRDVVAQPGRPARGLGPRHLRDGDPGGPRRASSGSPAASRPSWAVSAPAASWPASPPPTSPRPAGWTGWRRSASP